jgi:Porphobilinogen deaminase, C-terminal domain
MVSAERAFIDGIQGSCHTAVAGYSHLHGEAISMVAAVLSPDGKKSCKRVNLLLALMLKILALVSHCVYLNEVQVSYCSRYDGFVGLTI